MRQLYALAIAIGLATTLLAAPADAASRKYSISASTRVYEYKAGKYKYLSRTVMDVSRAHRRDYLLISGRVKRGPVKGKYVRIYATNTNDPKRRKNIYLGKVKLSSKGKFAKKVRPPRGGRWTYQLKVAKAGRYAAATRTVKIDAFHWTYLYELTNLSNVPGVSVQRGDARDTVGPDVTSDKGTVREGTRWTDQFAINGGASATFATKAHRCKKLAVKSGVSDRTPAEALSGRIEFVQNGAVRSALNMAKNDVPFNAADNSGAARKFRDSITAAHDVTIRVAATPSTDEEPAAQVRFIVGNAKAFCTFPSTN